MRTNLNTLRAALCSAARQAANCHEAFGRRVTGKADRQHQTGETAAERVHSSYLGLIRGVASQCSGSNDLKGLFTPAAYELLCQRSASQYYFWRIVAEAAEHTKALPMEISDIEGGLQQLRHRIFLATALGQRLMAKPLSSIGRLSASERTEWQREGFIVARHGMAFNAQIADSMEVNPVFA